jgi:hypothetical protein
MYNDAMDSDTAVPRHFKAVQYSPVVETNQCKPAQGALLFLDVNASIRVFCATFTLTSECLHQLQFLL